MVSRNGIVVALVVASGSAWAGTAVPPAPLASGEFRVLKVDDNLAYVGAGRHDGMAPGQALEVIERVEGQDGVESFHFGWLVLDSVNESVSLAKIPDDLKPHVRAGAIVRLPVGAAKVSPVEAPAAPEPASVKTPLAVAARVAPAVAETTSAEPTFHHEPPRLVPPGVPLTLTIYAPPPASNPLVMYRAVEHHEYTELRFEPRPDGYYTAVIPATEVVAPRIEYYLVIDEPEAARQLAFANPEEPFRVDVEGRFNASQELARYGVRDELSAMTEYVVYRSPQGGDHYARVEAEYLHRIFDTVYSMRFGAGWLTGQAYAQGATTPTDAGFLYAYTEAELRMRDAPVAFIPRLILGVNETGVGGGFEARLRLGDELGMNFEGGITVLSELGFDTFVALAIHPLPRLALALDARVENLPLASELGFRTYVDARYALGSGWGIALRLGVAARSIETVGPDTGIGVAYGF